MILTFQSYRKAAVTPPMHQYLGSRGVGLAVEMAPVLGISTEEALASPHAFVGNTQQIIDEVQQWRERWGFSYIFIDADVMECLLRGLAESAFQGISDT